MPSHLSEGARRLISKMLITNSEERATVPQIFDDPWFKVDLPDYLNPASAAAHLHPPQGRENANQLDETIVAKVAEVNSTINFLTNRV
jgi:carbon catabolite-derepressing protein kinase